ncbi:hypothetical protein FHY08_000103 [Pseudomonas koreensis]|nr:hypothetical protein [Pseudomonas koreensis]
MQRRITGPRNSALRHKQRCAPRISALPVARILAPAG